mmetsp:Transcript_19398/g.50421  ORF Transcript_19398/g.50421 Transcript_19398/m.50421 type:complete len:252 (-) Transcript_19398:46-801(-)
MDDRHLWGRQKHQRVADLLRKLLNQVERNPLKVRVPNQVVQVVRQVLKDEAQVIAMLKCPKEPHYVVPVVRVFRTHLLQQLHLNLGLISKGRLVLNNLNCHPLLLVAVVRLGNLPKRSLAKQALDVVSVMPDFAASHYVVAILVVVTVVENVLLFAGPLLAVIDLIDVLVRVDQPNAQLAQRSLRRVSESCRGLCRACASISVHCGRPRSTPVRVGVGHAGRSACQHQIHLRCGQTPSDAKSCCLQPGVSG